METKATVQTGITEGMYKLYALVSTGLPNNIYGSVKASKPKTLDETIELANDLTDQKLSTYAERQPDNKRKADDSSRNNLGHQQHPSKGQNVANVYNIGSGERKPYVGNLPKRKVFNSFALSYSSARLCVFQSESYREEDPPKDPPEVPMADNRTMAELLQAPTEGYEDAIFFPPSKTTNLRNEITRFQQTFHESFNEAWDRFNDLLRACPHHGFSELHQLDTFYNALNVNDQDSLNSAAVVKQGTEVTKDQVQTPSSQSTTPVQPPVAQSKTQTPGSEPVVAPVSAPILNLKPSIPYPSRRDNKRRRDQANEQIKKLYKIFKDMSFEISFTDALILMPKFTSTLKALIRNKEKLSEMARTLMNEHCSAVILNKLPRKLRDPDKFLIPCEFPGMDECLALTDLGASINLMPLSMWEGLSLPELTPTCMTLELADRSVSKPIGIAKDVSVKVEDDLNSPEFNPFYYDPEGDILLLETILNSKPLPPLPNHEKYLPSFKKELKVCEAKTVKSFVDEPPEVELKGLPHHLEYAFLEGDNKLPVIIAKELGDEEKSALIKVLKSHKRAIAWKLSDIQGINPKFYTHKILMEVDYKPAVQHQRRVNPKIHDVIKKEVEKLLDAGLIYPISDSPWASPVHCIPKKGGFTIVENKENELILTRLVTEWRGTNTIVSSMVSPGIFKFPLTLVIRRKQRSPVPTKRLSINACLSGCAMHRARFKVFGNSFENCLSRLDKMLQRCEDTNLCLNWEKSHFMVKDGIVLGHKISKNGIEVDKAKLDVIDKLPHPTTVKDCIKAFQMFKKKLTKAPILIAPNWDQPFKLMCDASDFAIGAILGQRHEKHFRPIYYASKMMTDAESNYTTTKKEMLAVVYAFEKFRSYLIMNKSIVHTDHFALKYLFAKKDAKARLLRFVLHPQELHILSFILGIQYPNLID
nr:DNA-directed DNA polymerase [Tanacetum cinerariifolium]